MSQIRNVMERAEKHREGSNPSTMQGVYAPSRKEPLMTNKTILWILFLQFLGIFILGGIFYGYIKQDSRESLNSIKDKLEQLEKKIDPLKDQLSRVEDAIKTVDKMAPRGIFSATETKTLHRSRAKETQQNLALYHKVERGETIYRISKRYGISAEEIRRLNNLKQDQKIKTGQKLLVKPAKH